MPEGLLKLGRGHLMPAAAMMAEAFSRDPMFEYILPDPEERKRALPAIFRGMLGVFLSFGGVYATSENLEGVICVSGLRGGGAERPLAGVLEALRMPFAVARRVSVLPMMKRAGGLRRGVSEYQSIKRNYEGGVYIDLVAVAEPYRGKGYMGRLMRPVLREADARGKACALDTESDGNIPIYEHYGFRLVKAIEAAPGGLRFNMLAREPADGIADADTGKTREA